MKATRFFAILIILFISNDIISQEDSCFQIISGTIKDKITNKIIKNATLELYKNNNLVKTLTSSNKGTFNIKVDCENPYTLVAKKNQYYETSKNFITSNVSNIKVEFTLYINQKKTKNCTQIINGKITDEFSNNPIEKATVEIRDSDEKLIYTDVTNSNGNYHFNLSCKQQYTILYSKKGYITSTTQIRTSKTNKKVEQRDIILHKKICNQSINGIIVNSETNEPIENTSVIILKDNIEVIRFNDLTKGTFQYTTACETQYKIKVSAPNYGFVTKSFKTTDVNNEPFNLIFNLNLVSNKSENIEEKNAIEVTVGKEEIAIEELDVNKANDKLSTSEEKNLKFNEVKFELNQSNISKNIANELNKIVLLMNNNSAISVQLNSYTDNRGPETYNQILTETRVQSMISYLISNGIDATRVTGKGYGNTKPLNECTIEKRCTEKEHQENKRIEFIFLNNDSD